MYLKSIALILAINLLSGCVATAKRSSVAFQKDSGGSMSVWTNDVNAALAYRNGQMCMQRAMVVKSFTADQTVKISDSIIELTKLLPDPKRNAEELISITSAIKTTATLLTSTTERTTFIDLSLFYICQMSANGSLTDDQTAQAIRATLITGATLGSNLTDTSIRDVLTNLNDKSVLTGINPLEPYPATSR